MDVHVTKKDDTLLIGNVSYITHTRTDTERKREGVSRGGSPKLYWITLTPTSDLPGSQLLNDTSIKDEQGNESMH